MRVIVVGGGVVGLCCAWHLQRQSVEVEVFEGGEFGRGASGANAGWVVPSLSTPLAAPGIIRAGIRHALDPSGALVIRPGLDTEWIRWLWRFRSAAGKAEYERGVRALMHLNARTMELFDQLVDNGVDFEMHAAGILALARDRRHMSWFTQLFAQLTALGYRGGITELSGAEICAVEPAVSEVAGAGALTSVDRHVQPNSLTSGLVADLRRRGVVLHEHAPVQGLRRAGGVWQLTTGGVTVSAPAVVVALGARINDLLRDVGTRLPVVGGKGYSVDLRGSGRLPLHALYLMEPKIGLSPYAGGACASLGSSSCPAGTTCHCEGAPARLSTSLFRSCATGSRARTAGKSGLAGLRPCTPDSLPFLGQVPGADGLYVATGHGMLGVTLAPATGEAIADMIVGRPIGETLLPFRLEGRI